MISKVKTPDDVKLFASQLVDEGTNFHPDDDFTYYVNLKTNKPVYTQEEATLRNNLMNQCFEVCKKYDTDIYNLMLEVFLQKTGLDEVIPLP